MRPLLPRELVQLLAEGDLTLIVTYQHSGGTVSDSHRLRLREVSRLYTSARRGCESYDGPVLHTLVPDPADLTDVLPTDRLLPNGMAIPEIRRELRRISNARNIKAVLASWTLVLSLVWLGTRGPWWLTILAMLAMGPLHVRFAILMHEAAHKLLFSRKSLNDLIGTWLIAYPALVPLSAYRRGHFAHHKEEFGPNEPDIAFYRGYPGTRADLRRRLIRDAVGISGAKNLRFLFLATTKASSRRVALSIIAVQVAMAVGLWLVTGRWWAYFVLWLAPWMTQWRVLNRLRAIAEHGGMQQSDDRRLTTHHVRQSLLARIWLVPFNTGWHLAHHVDMGVPWHQLPAFHDELVRAGYVTEDITFASYRDLWRAATAGSLS